MSSSQGTAAKVAQDYFSAWSAKDLDRTVSYAADGIVCDAPNGRVEGLAQFRDFWDGFFTMLVGANLIGLYGDDENAVLVYDCETIPVKNAPAAEYLTVKDGKITSIRMVFDTTPFREAQARAAQQA
jgi:SnoaL-like domain